MTMILPLFFFSFLIAFCVAKLEINIEGKDGWAKNLPTWRAKNEFTKIIFGEQYVTGYHAWLFLTTFLLIHLPFVMGVPWTLANELILIAFYLFTGVLEDFFWFILNPAYGLGKFNKKNVTWHKDWVGNIPLLYLKGLVLSLGLLLISVWILN